MGAADKQNLIHDSGEGEWLSIGLDAIRDTDVVPCDLFRRAGGTRFVLIAQNDLPLPANFKQRLQEVGLTNLYIRDCDFDCYLQYLHDTLQVIVQDPHISSERKAAVVYVSCQEIMPKVYDDPRASFISSSFSIIQLTVDFIISDNPAVKCLSKLTSYDESTYTRCTNVSIFGVALSRRFFSAQAEKVLVNLSAGFFLHDLGNCRIPFEILNKPGPLTDEERRVVNLNLDDGFEILQEA